MQRRTRRQWRGKVTSVWPDSKPAMQCRMLHMLVQRGCYPRSAIGGSRGSSAGGKLLVHRSLLECLVQLRTCTVSKGPGRGCISSFTGASYPMLRAASRSRHVLLECDYSPKALKGRWLIWFTFVCFSFQAANAGCSFGTSAMCRPGAG